jgi:hypothetical protein
MLDVPEVDPIAAASAANRPRSRRGFANLIGTGNAGT